MFAVLPAGRTSILAYVPQEPVMMLVLGPIVMPLMLDMPELDPGGKKA
jgi:hypothetical protein